MEKKKLAESLGYKEIIFIVKLVNRIAMVLVYGIAMVVLRWITKNYGACLRNSYGGVGERK
jgi:hypothetical protein